MQLLLIDKEAPRGTRLRRAPPTALSVSLMLANEVTEEGFSNSLTATSFGTRCLN